MIWLAHPVVCLVVALIIACQTDWQRPTFWYMVTVCFSFFFFGGIPNVTLYQLDVYNQTAVSVAAVIGMGVGYLAARQTELMLERPR